MKANMPVSVTIVLCAMLYKHELCACPLTTFLFVDWAYDEDYLKTASW